MYHTPHENGTSTSYNYNNYRENRRSTPSYALVPHNSNSGRRVQYAATRYHTEPIRYHTETRYNTAPTRYNSQPRLYGDSRDHFDTYQEQRYVIPYNNTHTQYRNSRTHVDRHSDGQLVPARYVQYNGQPARAYKYRRRDIEKSTPVCACVIT